VRGFNHEMGTCRESKNNKRINQMNQMRCDLALIKASPRVTEVDGCEIEV
jgi:hypothetical protein